MYGAHSVFLPSAPTTVWSPSQVPVETHFCVARSQRLPFAQSSSREHVAAQRVPAQANGAQLFGIAAGHLPLPSHLVASVSVPSLQAAARQVTSGPANALHASRVLPSHAAAVHASSELAAGQVP